MTFPRLRLRDEVAPLLDLPWELPLADWDDGNRFRDLPVGPVASPGPVPRLRRDRLRAQGAAGARSPIREYDVLRHLEDAGLPAVRAVGLAERPADGDAILVTEYLAHSLQYRRLLMRLRVDDARVPRPAARRDGPAPRRPPPGRRLLGRLLAREHAVPARRRPDPGVPRRRRDERGPPHAVGRPAPVRPRDPRRERRLRPRRPRGLPGQSPRTSTRPSTPRSPCGPGTTPYGRSCTTSRT